MVLLVDDQLGTRRIVSSFLTQAGGHRVKSLSNGGDAVSELNVNIDRYGLVIASWDMKPLPGLQLLKVIRASRDERQQMIPFLMISDSLTEIQVRLSKVIGVDAFLATPISLKTFCVAANRAVSARNARNHQISSAAVPAAENNFSETSNLRSKNA